MFAFVKEYENLDFPEAVRRLAERLKAQYADSVDAEVLYGYPYLWDAIKQVASDALIRCGGTITHHHAVGRDHRPWYDHERPDGRVHPEASSERHRTPS